MLSFLLLLFSFSHGSYHRSLSLAPSPYLPPPFVPYVLLLVPSPSFLSFFLPLLVLLLFLSSCIFVILSLCHLLSSSSGFVRRVATASSRFFFVFRCLHVRGVSQSCTSLKKLIDLERNSLAVPRLREEEEEEEKLPNKEITEKETNLQRKFLSFCDLKRFLLFIRTSSSVLLTTYLALNP